MSESSFLIREFNSNVETIIERLSDIRARGERIAITPHPDGYWGVVLDLQKEARQLYDLFREQNGMIEFAHGQLSGEHAICAYSPNPLSREEIGTLTETTDRILPMVLDLVRWLVDQGRATRGHYYRPLHGELKTPRRLTNYFRYRRSRRMRYRIPF